MNIEIIASRNAVGIHGPLMTRNEQDDSDDQIWALSVRHTVRFASVIHRVCRTFCGFRGCTFKEYGHHAARGGDNCSLALQHAVKAYKLQQKLCLMKTVPWWYL